ncbi:MAG: serine/threonine-protein kinase [Pseudomonadota bacterium]
MSQRSPGLWGRLFQKRSQPESGGEPELTTLVDRPREPGDLLLGTCRILEVLPGSWGAVYVVSDPAQDIVFAVKQPPDHAASDPDFSARAAAAASNWNSLGMHPHVAYLYFARQEDGLPYLFVEHVPGQTLRRRLEGGLTDYKAGIKLALEVARGMEHAHRRGVLHRGLRPENILIQDRGVAKITDFGLAAAWRPPVAKGRKRDPAAGHLPPAYVPFEAWENPAPATPENPGGVGFDSDVFNFGVCLWEVFLGKTPYRDTAKKPSAPPRDPSEIRPDFPDPLKTLLYRCVAPDRAERYPDFSAVLADLEQAWRAFFSSPPPALPFQPGDFAADCANNRGWLAWTLGEKEEARRFWHQALARDRTHPQAAYNLARARYLYGEKDDTAFLASVRQSAGNPAHRAAADELAACVHAARGDSDAAADALRHRPERFQQLFSESPPGRTGVAREFLGHPQAVTCASMNSDGRFTVTGSQDGSVRLWQTATGECLAEMQAHQGSVNSVDVSANGRLAVSGGADYAIRIWSFPGGRLVGEHRDHSLAVNGVAITGDGRFALSGGGDSTVRFWDIIAGSCTAQFVEHTSRVLAVDMTADGQTGLSLAGDNSLFVWSLALGAGKRLASLEGPQGALTTAVLSDNGRQVLAGDSRGNLLVFDVAKKSLDEAVAAHGGPVTAVSLSASGQVALSVGKNGKARLWRMQPLRCVRTLEGFSGPSQSVALSADGRLGVVPGPGNRASLLEIAPENPVPGPFLSRAGRQDFRAMEKSIHAQKLDQARLLAERGHLPQAQDLLQFAWKNARADDEKELEALYLGLVPKGRLKSLFACQSVTPLKGHTDRVRDLAFFPDATRAASASYDRTARVWHLASGRSRAVVRGHADGLAGVAVSPDGLVLATGGLDKAVRLANPGTGDPIRRVVQENRPVLSLAFAAQDKLLVGTEKLVTAYHPKSGQRVGVMNASRPDSIRLDEAGAFGLWRTDGGNAGYYELTGGSLVKDLVAHKDEVVSLDITVLGRFGVTGDRSGTVIHWHLPTARPLATLQAHREAVTGLALSFCGSVCVSGSESGELKIWDLLTSEMMAELPSHAPGIQCLALSRNARHLLVGGPEGSISLYRLAWTLEFPAKQGRTSAFGRV